MYRLSTNIYTLTRILAAAIIVMLTACSHDDPEPVTPTFDKPQLKDNTYVLSYTDYLHSNDVKIVSVDSTYIEADIDYLISIDADPAKGDVIVVWQSPASVPFIRRIIGLKNTGMVLRLETENADFSDLFSNADIVLSTDLKRYVTSDENDFNKLYSNDNVYHPAMIIQHNADGTAEALTPEQILSHDPSWNIIDNGTGIDSTYTINGVTLGINEATVIANTGVKAVLTVNNGLLRRFECTVSGQLKINSTTRYYCNEATELSMSDVIDAPVSYTIVYWVESVPVAIGINTSSSVKIDIMSSGAISFATPSNSDTDFNIGSIFRTEWRPVKDVSLNFRSNLTDAICPNGCTASTSLTAFLANKVSIFDDFFSYTTIGYSISTTWANDGNATHTIGDFTFDGNVENTNTIQSAWKVSEWTSQFNILSTRIWDTTLSD